MTLNTFTRPPDTRAVGTGNPPQDMNSVVDELTATNGASILNTAYAGGAPLDGTSDATAAIQACMNAAAPFGVPVLIPAGVQFRVSSLTWNAGQVLQGVYSGTYPGDDTITTASVLSRLASSNEDMIVVPDGTNYGMISDLALDGNKSQNTAGYGINIQDGASGQETQIQLIRCFVHDNPYSNVYLGNNRRANAIWGGAFNQSATGDGITVAGSDNTIWKAIIGNNARAGVAVGTTTTQNWSGAVSGGGSSDVCHVLGNDIFENEVGVAIAQSATNALVALNGIDRNTKQGITVYDGASNTIENNALHSNGTATDNTYAHIDVAAGITQVGINNNNFGPLDSGISNRASFGVNVASGAPAGCIVGNIGNYASTAFAGTLISTLAAASPPWVSLAKTGAIIQGASGEDILRLLRSGGGIAMKVTQNGTIVYPGSFQLDVQGSPPVAVAGAAAVYADASGCLHSIAPTGAGGGDVNLISGAFLCTPTSYAPGSQTALTVTGATIAAFSTSNVNTGSFTAPPSGSVLVTVSFVAELGTGGTGFMFGLVAHGTTTVEGNLVEWQDGTANVPRPVQYQFLVTGLTAGTAYNFDLAGACSAAGDTVTVLAFGQAASSTTRGAPVVMTVQAV